MGQRADLYARWKAADEAVSAIIAGAQSATVSSGTGSKSYTRANLSVVIAERDKLARAIAKLDRGGRPPITRVRIESV